MIIEEFRRFLKEHTIEPTITLEEFFNDDLEETEMYTKLYLEEKNNDKTGRLDRDNERTI